MKAIAIENFGGADRLKLMELPKPVPQDNEVLIEVAYASINPVDWKIREGYLKDLLPHEFPLIPGWDAAGSVSAVGAKVKDFKPGDRVYAYCRKPLVRWGTYAEYVTVDAASAAPMPKNISFAQAAAIPLTGLTAWQALFDFAKLKSGQTVLIHAGAGGVGSLAIQFARHAGATVLTTASAGNHSYLKSLGAQHAIDYLATDFVAAAKQLAPQGVDVVFDTVGGETQKRSLDVLKPGATLVSIVDAPDEKIAAQRGVRAGFVFVSPSGPQLREITQLIETGAVKPPRIEEMALKDAAAAHEKSSGRHVIGKLVLRIH